MGFLSTIIGPSLAVAALSATLVNAASYPIVESHSGETFFNGFTFYNHYDNLTSGDVVYVNSSAQTPELAYYDGTNTIIKVDNITTVPYNDKRDSVRITSNTAYGPGTVWVMDASHLPWGCSVWPAYWLQGQNWPIGGEIDILEGVNQQTTNQMALHTVAGCVPATSSSNLTGSIGYSDCDYTANSGSGCTITNNNTNSYGPGFNSAGGGVWVTEMTDAGIKIWFFTRSSVPSQISKSATSIDTSSLGTPVAAWSSSGCSPISTYFSALNVVIDITLCGTYAGVPSILGDSGCTVPASPQTCYTTYVLNSTNYNDAYFTISYLSIFSTNGTTVTKAGSSASASAASASASASSTGKSAATRISLDFKSAIVAGVLLLAGALTLMT